MGIAAILINGSRPFVQYLINRRLKEKFEENWPRGFREEVFKGVDGRTKNDHNSPSCAFGSGELEKH